MTSFSKTPPTLLLVDDEAPFVEAMSKRLGKRGFEVLKAYSGQQALEVMEAEGPLKIDVVILDVKMPVMDGIETLAAIKEKYPNTEVIMLTGHATVENAVEGLKGGAFDYLMKPCDMEELVDKVAMAAENRRKHLVKIQEAQQRALALGKGVD